MGQFITKLKEDFIVLIVGLVIGIPALGILLPNLFAYMAERSTGHFDLSCLLRLFSLIYFTLPFLIILVSFSFLQNGYPDNTLKILSAVFAFLLFLLTVLILLFHAGSMDHAKWCFPAVCIVAGILLLVLCIFWMVEVGEYYPDAKEIFAHNFGTLFLFIPIQWTVSFCMTILINADANGYFVLGACFFYLVPLLLSILRTVRLEQKDDEEVNQPKYIAATAFVSVGLIAILIFGREKMPISAMMSRANTFSWDYEQRHYDSLFKASAKLDTIRKEQANLKKLSQLDELKIRLDSINYLLTHSDTSKTAIDSNSFGHASAAYWKALLEVPEVQTLRARVFSGNWKNISRTDSTLLIHAYQEFLQKDYETSMSFAKEQLLRLIHDMQKTGSIIFLSAILILVVIQLVLYLNGEGMDKRYSVLYRKKIAPAGELSDLRARLQVALLVICILLFPLLKTVTEEELNPEHPFAIYKIPNWNMPVAVSQSISSPPHSDSIFVQIKDTCCRKIDEIKPTIINNEKITAALDSINNTIKNIKSVKPTIDQSRPDTFSVKLALTNNFNAELDKLIERLAAIDKSIRDGQVPVKAVADRIKGMSDTLNLLKITIQNINRKQP